MKTETNVVGLHVVVANDYGVDVILVKDKHFTLTLDKTRWHALKGRIDSLLEKTDEQETGIPTHPQDKPVAR